MTAQAHAARRPRLTAAEMASAATMAAVCAGLVVAGSLLPSLGGLQILAVVPFGVSAHRHGHRALAAALVSSAVLVFLISGPGSVVNLAALATLGGLVGILKRHGRGLGSVCLAALVLAPLAAGALDLLLFAFAAYRRLVLANLRAQARGLGSLLGHVSPRAEHLLERVATVLTAHWAILAAAGAALATTVVLLVSWALIGAVLERLSWVSAGDSTPLEQTPAADGEDTREPAPLPVTLVGAACRYGSIEALRGVDLSLCAGELVAVVGDNGSGKSTLARLLAGQPPSAGAVTRPGPVGLGRPGGTALIGQRPDTQVLGLRVRDDVTWGLEPEEHPDVEELLSAVGLAGMAGHDTASLSGGQLQRLAVAGALARRPVLLISDESTAMVDPEGRHELMRVLAELPRSRRMSVVHITHHEDELAYADRVLRLAGGRLVTDTTAGAPLLPRGAPTLTRGASVLTRGAPTLTRAGSPAGARPSAPGGGTRRAPRLVLDGVGHLYAHRTPWEHRALEDVTLTVEPGEGVLIVGDNGSGKSTLAWILAGLITPTEGSCLIDAAPSHRVRGAVGLAFQHARLQLQRPTVGEEIADAAGWSRHGRRGEQEATPDPSEVRRRVRDALASVGLDPELAERSIERLSGGQQRRVAIAGLLAHGPGALVLDEPLAGLDAPGRASLIAPLARLRERDGLTLIVVTHDHESLAELCPRTVRLDRGRVVADTTTGAGPTGLRSEAA